MDKSHNYSYDHFTSARSSSYSYVAPIVIAGLPGKNLRILDLGCGNGCLCGVLADMGHEVTGVDGSETGIAIAKKNHPRARFINADIYDLEAGNALEKNYFDVVVSVEVIEHLSHPRELMKAAKKFLKHGGSFILSTPYHGYLKNLAIALLNRFDGHIGVTWDVGHVKFFSPASLKVMLAGEGFSGMSFNYAGRFPGFWKSMICTAKKEKAV